MNPNIYSITSNETFVSPGISGMWACFGRTAMVAKGTILLSRSSECLKFTKFLNL